MNTMVFIQNIGGGSLLLIFVVILLLFGAKGIPELAKGLGKGLMEFKKATKEIQEEIESDDKTAKG
ncbi:MAG TPA: twin-arginine translocase TatA/TatE family subunit [Cyclobacteriaceae bacterium]|nr:twin-arginine translocase TatA/TatE family subunit [Cyclobacteriaceae bacterium]